MQVLINAYYVTSGIISVYCKIKQVSESLMISCVVLDNDPQPTGNGTCSSVPGIL